MFQFHPIVKRTVFMKCIPIVLIAMLKMNMDIRETKKASVYLLTGSIFKERVFFSSNI